MQIDFNFPCAETQLLWDDFYAQGYIHIDMLSSYYTTQVYDLDLWIFQKHGVYDDLFY